MIEIAKEVVGVAFLACAMAYLLAFLRALIFGRR